MIRARGLTKRYRGHVALADVDFTVNAGEAVGLLGANGAGKTTLLALLAAATKPTSGDAEVAGASVTAAPKRVRQAVGYAPQRGGLYPELTVTENVRFFARLAGVKDAAAVARAIERVEMTALAKRRTGALSGGERQRASLAAALVHDPKVVLLDEPATGLDPAARERVWRIARDLKGEGRAVVLSTHAFDEAVAVCDRVVFLQAGRIVDEAAAAEASRFKDRYREAVA